MYFTSVYRSDQDVVETLCVLDHVLAQMKTDYLVLKDFTVSLIMQAAMQAILVQR